MKIKKPLLVCLFLSLMLLGIWFVNHNPAPILKKSIHTETAGDITVTQPLWGSQGLALVFADTHKFPVIDLGQHLAATGITAAIVDPLQFYKRFNAKTGQCLDAQQVSAAIEALVNDLPNLSLAAPVSNWLAAYTTSLATNRLIIAGISEGALIPFINAQSKSENAASNLSIGFSVNLPAELALCPPFSSQQQNQQNILLSSPKPKDNWRSVWADKPANETAIFIKTLGQIDTRIAAYNTPLDTLLIEEVKTSLGQSGQSSAPMPVVEVPAAKPSDTVTLFYSGDGGWRDLDRAIAGEMAALNYPVVGVDVLRYFWEHKSPEQAAADLAATMAYYRKNWQIKSFVLAGYSFGADILPAIYNRLPPQDKDSVALLALLALANHADFEIHVSGWLGQSGAELALAPELAQIPKNKILCIYGQEEKAETACTSLLNSDAKILELPGGHHFDENYPKLTRQILDIYRQHGIN